MHHALTMPGSASNVELTSLVNGDSDRRAKDDENDIILPPSEDNIYLGKASRPLGSGSGYSGRDVLLFLLVSISGVLLILIVLLLFKAPKTSVTSIRDGYNIFGPKRPNNTKDIAGSIDTTWTHMRWKPFSANDTDDNCYPGFRLANATLHCGIGEKSDNTTDLDGTQYCGGVRLEPNFCIMPTDGIWEVPYSSPHLESIAPLHGRFGIKDSNATLPRCETMDQLIDGGLAEDGEWVPVTCYAVPLSPFVWTENAQCQTTITMIGDSHIRNLFTATLNGLRGIESFAEGHSDAGKRWGEIRTYEWRLKDGIATDQADVYTNTSSDEPTPFEDCPCGEVQRCLRMAFLWAPTFKEQLKQVELAEKWQNNLIIVEPGNSYEGSVALSPDWTTKFDELLQQHENLHLSILHFSWGHQPPERPAALKEWTGNGTNANRMSYLPQSAIVQENNQQSGSTWHFTCSLEKVDVVNDGINAVEPCMDITDTAQIRAIITVHFSAFLDNAE